MESFIGICISIVVIIIIIALFAKSARNARNEERKAHVKLANERAVSALEVYLSRNRLPIYQGPVPIMLKADEYPIACSESRLAEERSVSNYSGMSFRVAQGMYYRTGQSSGQTHLSIIDTGRLVLTTKRLVFVGLKRTSTVDLKKLVNVELYSDAITIHKDGKVKAETYFIDTPSVYKSILELLNKFPFTKEDETTLVANSASK